MPEKDWKPWRAVFNKGFSADHVLSLVSDMLKETVIYSEILRDLVQKGTMFYLDTTTLRFTMDMIGRTILNASLGAQKGYNVLADCMLSQIRWHQPNAEASPLGYLNIPRWYMQWWNGRQMDHYIGQELDKRYLEYKADPGNLRRKAIVDLVLQAHVPEHSEAQPGKLDSEFRVFAIRQIRLFVFAGHDSTSSTICYSLHLLSQNKDALARLRAEHDAVFGKDITAVSSILEKQPHLINNLPYTTAVIQKVLRLFAPASCSRRGKPNVNITDDQGNTCPTDEAMIWIVHVEMHRSPKFWTRPEEFLPERWLVEPGHELYPRNCVAQGL